MLISVAHKIQNEQLKSLPNSEILFRKNLTSALANELEKKAEVIKESDKYYQTHKIELVVLSMKDVKEIGEIISTLGNYAKDYPAMYAVQDKLKRIREIFLENSSL